MALRQDPYAAFTKEKFTLRDQLALDDTRLAAERTMLSYERTAIVLLASAGTLIKVFPDDRMLMVIGYALIPASIVMGLLGFVRFLRISRILRKVGKPGTVASPST